MSIFRIFAFVLTLLGFIVSASTPMVLASGVDAANAGVKALNQGDSKKAKVLFRSALKSNELTKKNYIIVNNKLCDVLRSESSMAQAINCFSESLYLNPDNPPARFGRGFLYKDIGEYKRAIKDLSRYIALAPRDDLGFIHRGLSHWALRDNDRAISDLSQAIALRPGNGTWYVHRGNTFFETGNYNLAMADFEKAVAVDPYSASACQALAWFYAACPNVDFRHGTKAVKFAQKALEADKNDRPGVILFETLAAAYAESGLFEKAVETQRQALALVGEPGVDSGSREKSKSRLELYQSGTPYRGSYTPNNTR